MRVGEKMGNVIKELLVAVISGGIGAAIIKLLGDDLAWKRTRSAAKEDSKALCTEERLKAIEKKTDAQSEALKFILYDRIRYLGQAYIAEKAVDFDDRRILSDMHRSYHNGLGGNGDLDALMAEVNRLPLKTVPKKTD